MQYLLKIRVSDIIIFIDTLVNYKTMPKTKEQFEQIRQERINTIMESALKLFAMKGYDAVSLDEVSKDANCSHGLLYHYFESKKDLYIAVVNKIVMPYMKDMVTGINFDQKAKFTAHDLIEATLKRIKMVDDRNPWIIYLFLNIHLQKNLFNKKVCERTPALQYIEDLIKRGQEEGDFNSHNPVELAISVLFTFKGLAFTRIHIGYKRFLSPSSDVIMRMLYK